ncbi:hypothetical protein [Halobaculum marinum]|uniref:Uncharacterized protein n=1 Tax=Halobaculum marinum TaxID=3031996 RepID=A0ABD5WQH3_9EURY|nr:hypothetical protein [Halobaculum sp. DT55]
MVDGTETHGQEEGRHTGGSNTAAERPVRSERFWLALTGVLVVTMPALTLVIAYAVLTATRSVLVGAVTPIEVVELYLVELFAFALFAVILYRLARYSIRRTGGDPE